VLGLYIGPDDYVVKPFSPRELIASIKYVVLVWGYPLSNIPPWHTEVISTLREFQELEAHFKFQFHL
jgi:hypothetical protein